MASHIQIPGTSPGSSPLCGIDYTEARREPLMALLADAKQLQETMQNSDIPVAMSYNPGNGEVTFATFQYPIAELIKQYRDLPGAEQHPFPELPGLQENADLQLLIETLPQALEQLIAQIEQELNPHGFEQQTFPPPDAPSGEHY